MHIEVSQPVIAGCIVGAALVFLTVRTISIRLKSAASPATVLALAEHRLDRIYMLFESSVAGMSPAEQERLIAERIKLEQKMPFLRRSARTQELKEQLRDLKARAKTLDAEIEAAQLRQVDPTFLLTSRTETYSKIEGLKQELRDRAA